MWVITGRLGRSKDDPVSSVWIRPSRTYAIGRLFRVDFNWEERILSRSIGQIEGCDPDGQQLSDPMSDGPTYQLVFSNFSKKALSLKKNNSSGTSPIPPKDGRVTIESGDEIECVPKNANMSRNIKFEWKPVTLCFASVTEDRFTKASSYFHSVGIRVFKDDFPLHCTHLICRRFRSTPHVFLAAMHNAYICKGLLIDYLITATKCPDEPDKQKQLPTRTPGYSDESYKEACVEVLADNLAGTDPRWWKRSPLEIDFTSGWPSEVDFFPPPDGLEEHDAYDLDKWRPSFARNNLFKGICMINFDIFDEDQNSTSKPNLTRDALYSRIMKTGRGYYKHYDLTKNLLSSSSPKDDLLSEVNKICQRAATESEVKDIRLAIIKPLFLEKQAVSLLCECLPSLKASMYIKAENLSFMIRDAEISPNFLENELYSSAELDKMGISLDASKKHPRNEQDVTMGMSNSKEQEQEPLVEPLTSQESAPLKRRKLLRKPAKDKDSDKTKSKDLLDDMFSNPYQTESSASASASQKLDDSNCSRRGGGLRMENSNAAGKGKEIEAVKEGPSPPTKTPARTTAASSPGKGFKLKRKIPQENDPADTSFGLPPENGSKRHEEMKRRKLFGRDTKNAGNGENEEENDNDDNIETRHRNLLKEAERREKSADVYGMEVQATGSNDSNTGDIRNDGSENERTEQNVIEGKEERNNEQRYLQVGGKRRGTRKNDINEAEFNEEFNKLKVVRPVFRKTTPQVRERIEWQDKEPRDDRSKRDNTNNSSQARDRVEWDEDSSSTYFNIKYFNIRKKGSLDRQAVLQNSSSPSNPTIESQNDHPNFKAFKSKKNGVSRTLGTSPRLSNVTLQPSITVGLGDSNSNRNNSGSVDQYHQRQDNQVASDSDEILELNDDDDDGGEHERLSHSQKQPQQQSQQRSLRNKSVPSKRKNQAALALADHESDDSDDDGMTFKGFR